MSKYLNVTPRLRKGAMILAALLSPGLSLMAQTANQSPAATPDTFLSNPLFIMLLSVFILIFIIIVVMADVVKSVAKGIRSNPSKTTGKILTVLVLITALYPGIAGAQTQDAQAPAVEHVTSYGGLSPMVFWSMIAAIVAELAILAVLIIIVNNLVAPDESESAKKVVPVAEEEPSFMEMLNKSVPIEDEKSILMDHDYDGIRELDNDLPPWWKYGFYITILVAFGYIIHYHITQTGDLQLAEYQKEMKAADAEQAERMKNAKNLIDEHTVTFMNDAANLKAGQDLFIANCAACHLPDGGGIVGPNLTDDYWIHGGSIGDIFKTIKNGYQEKGMKAWKDDFSPEQIAQLASFVKSLRGTHPATPKEPQGDLYVEKGAAPPVAKTDSLKAPADTTKK